MKNGSWFNELPEGYVLRKTVDAVKDKKFVLWMNLAACFLTVAVAGVAYLLKSHFLQDRLLDSFLNSESSEVFWRFEGILLCFVGVLLLYIVLHEMVHGVAYKIMTGQKLTFGVSLSCAYCGVPSLYLSRRTALISLLAPFTVFNLIFLVFAVFANGIIAFAGILMLGIHVGGCAGDLYDTCLLLFRFKNNVIINDNGPCQTFYEKDSKQQEVKSEGME